MSEGNVNRGNKKDRLKKHDSLIYVEKRLYLKMILDRKSKIILFIQSESIVLIGAITRRYSLYFGLGFASINVIVPRLPETGKEGVVMPSSSLREDLLLILNLAERVPHI